MICAYPAGCTESSTNGNGAIELISIHVTGTLNGEYVVHIHRRESNNMTLRRCYYIYIHAEKQHGIVDSAEKSLYDEGVKRLKSPKR